MEFVEINLFGRHYETVITQWDDSRFLCKTYRQPTITGWKSKAELQAIMVLNVMASRCCNVHGERLVIADGSGLSAEQLSASKDKKEQYGQDFLKCPNASCDVGVWSKASSLPGGSSLRTARSEVFRAMREDRNLILKRAQDANLIEGAATFLQIGSLNLVECGILLGRGLEVVDSIEQDEDDVIDIAAVRRRLAVKTRSVELTDEP